jgi:hypothetical protein
MELASSTMALFVFREIWDTQSSVQEHRRLLGRGCLQFGRQAWKFRRNRFFFTLQRKVRGEKIYDIKVPKYLYINHQ